MTNNTLENSNDQNQEQDLDFVKEANRHKERMAEINNFNAQEERKIYLDERRTVLQEKESEARLKADQAKSETANNARMALLGLVEKGIDFLQNKVYPDYRLDKAQRWRFNEGLRAAREGIFCTFGADGSVTFTSAKVGVGIVMDTCGDKIATQQSPVK